MVCPQGAPMLGWEKLLEEELRAVKQVRSGQKSPFYGEQALHRPSCESFTSSETSGKSAKSSKMASLKNFLRGNVQRHHGMYTLEESITGQPSAARNSSTTSSNPSSEKSRSTTSSIKKFLKTLEEKAEKEAERRQRLYVAPRFM